MRNLYPLKTVSVSQKENIHSINTSKNRGIVCVLQVIVTKVVTLIHPSTSVTPNDGFGTLPEKEKCFLGW